jgi:putative NADH-flavin reductase
MQLLFFNLISVKETTMNLLILGATGGTGQQLVTQALEQGYTVTALARSPEKISIKNDRLTVVQGDVLDEEIMNALIPKQDAILSALGVTKTWKAGDLMTKAVTLLVKLMSTHNKKRLILVSAFGAGESFEQANPVQKFIFRYPLGSRYADKTRSEEILKKQNFDWTVIYPVLLTNGPHTGTYRVGEKMEMRGMPTISRADVADFVLRELKDNRFVRKFPIIMY